MNCTIIIVLIMKIFSFQAVKLLIIVLKQHYLKEVKTINEEHWLIVPYLLP